MTRAAGTLAAAAALGGALAWPASAETFAMPEGCEAFLTVGARDCTMTHHARCAGDPDGWRREFHVDAAGASDVIVFDGDGQPARFVGMDGLDVEAETIAAADPMSMSSLLDEGDDEVALTMTVSGGGVSFEVVLEARFWLTGQTLVVDGETLEAVAYDSVSRLEGGSIMSELAGVDHVSRARRIQFGGPSFSGASEDDTPAAFVEPGEPGFLAARPTHGCGPQTSATPLAPVGPGDHITPAAAR